MTFNTHNYLGTLLYPIISENWDIPINKKRFLYGCVKPDITSLFFTHPHFYRISKKYVFKRINKLTKRKPGIWKKNKKFSEELGIILHYMADFFTTVHNTVPNHLREHIEFENFLQSDFESCVDIESVRKYFLFLKNRVSSAEEIRTEIIRLHKINQGDMTTTYDIHEILTACIISASGIMNAVSLSAEKSKYLTNLVI